MGIQCPNCGVTNKFPEHEELSSTQDLICHSCKHPIELPAPDWASEDLWYRTELFLEEPEKIELDPGWLKSFTSEDSPLPVMPHVVARVLEMHSDPKIEIRHYSEVISHDQAFTALVLKLCNSAYYSFQRKISNLSHGIALLGADTVHGIALMYGMENIFSSKSEDPFIVLLWKHSLGCALGAKLISQRLGREEPEEAFIGGILHDLGKAIFYIRKPQEYQKVVSQVQGTGQLETIVERRELGMDHTDVGGALLENWQLPPQLVEAIEFHHLPHRSPSFQGLSSVVSLSNLIMKKLGVGTEAVPALELSLSPAVDYLGLGEEQLKDLYQEIEMEIRESDLFSVFE